MHSTSHIYPCILLIFIFQPIQTRSHHDPQLEIMNNSGVTAGGEVYRKNIGDTKARQVLESGMRFTTNLLRVKARGVTKITLTISSLPLEETASTISIDNMSFMYISEEHLADFQGNVTREFQGLVYEYMAYVWMNGLNVAPPGLTTGIAKFVRLAAGLAPDDQFDPQQFVTSTTTPWQNGTYATAHFLQYLQTLHSDFVASLNRKMANGWSENFSRDLLGTSVDRLWQEWAMKPHPSPLDVAPINGVPLAIHASYLVVLLSVFFLGW